MRMWLSARGWSLSLNRNRRGYHNNIIIYQTDTLSVLCDLDKFTLAPARTVILFVGTRNTRTRGGAANERSWTERGATADVIMSVTKDCGKFE
jgi:hypothetical protein